MKRFFIYLVPLLFVIACKSSQKISSEYFQDDGKIEFTILQVNDVYEIAPLESGKTGGLARIATLNDQLSAINPNIYTVLAGDFLSPSLIGTLKLDGKKIAGAQMVEAMNSAGFDLVTFGNHEFDLDYPDLQDRINESEFQWISSNVLHVTEDSSLHRFYKSYKGGKLYVPDSHIWEIRDKDGSKARIGFLGVTLPTFTKPFVHYEDFYLEARKAYEHLSGKCDIVIGITHLEREQDSMLAMVIPEVPLLVGGHDHENMIFKVGPATVAKADANAKTAYVHKFTYNTFFKTHQLESTLVKLDEKIELQPATSAVVDKWQDILMEKIKEIVKDPNEVIYNTTIPLDGREASIRNKQTNLGGIITAAMKNAFDENIDAAIMNSGSVRIDDQLHGNITPVDIFRVLPFGGEVLKVKMSGKLLKKVLNEGKDKKGKGAYLQRHNITYDENGQHWLVGTAPIADESLYVIAINDFLIKGMDINALSENAEGVAGVERPAKNSTAYDIRKVVVEYLKTLDK